MPTKQAVSARRKGIMRLASRYDREPAHSRQVARLALLIFDQTAQLHKLDGAARELLEYACLLHDIGWAAGETKHKRFSYEIIKAADLDAFSEAQKEIIASVARYHGVKPPREHHPWNQVLSPEDKRRVRYLSAIIRIADALDRNHLALIEDVKCSVAGGEMTLELKSSYHPQGEIWALRRKKDYFERLFKTRVEVKHSAVPPPYEPPTA
jgi:exopolyphosphatase/guanosine-5'-triphosphate,3'-diphosphate pyrophosphatase